MGIKDIGELIKKHAPNAKSMVDISYFGGKKMAIDGNSKLYAVWCVAHNLIAEETDVMEKEIDLDRVYNVWVSKTREFVNKLIKNEITPIFVFDGVAPIEKLGTQTKRRESSKTAAKKMEKIKEDYDISKAFSSISLDSSFDTEKAVEKARIHLRQMTRPENHHYERLIADLNSSGVIAFKAKTEAERLCVSLKRDKKVDYIMVNDTDCLAHGCDEFIFKIDQDDCTIIHLDKILSDLNLSFESFLHACIMLGCDYNERIPQVGIVRVLRLINEYKTIDNIPVTVAPHLKINFEIHKECLKHEKCLELFAPISSSELLPPDVEL